MADDVDNATEHYGFLFEKEIVARQQRMARPSNTHCEECDCVIPERRRLLMGGITHCVDCQDRKERRR